MDSSKGDMSGKMPESAVNNDAENTQLALSTGSGDFKVAADQQQQQQQPLGKGRKAKGIAAKNAAPVPSLVRTLCERPFFVSISKLIGGTTQYEYRFSLTETKGEGNLRGIVDIRRKSDGKQSAKPKPVRNHFRLLLDPDSEFPVYNLSCTRLQDGPRLVPPICLPLYYQSRTKCWVATSTFANMRSVFSLNSFEDGFGLWATFGCVEMTLQFSTDLTPGVGGTGNLTITCYGPLGVQLNQGKPDDKNLDDEDDECQDDDGNGDEDSDRRTRARQQQHLKSSTTQHEETTLFGSVSNNNHSQRFPPSTSTRNSEL